MTVNNTDTFLVERSGTSYKLQAQNLMADLQDTDLMLVERSGTSYKATGLDIKNSLGSDEPTFKATASGAISAGDPVVLNDDGTVSAVSSSSFSASASTGTQLSAANNQSPYRIVYDPTGNRVFAIYPGSGARDISCKIGTFSGSNKAITWASSFTTIITSNKNITGPFEGVDAVWDDDNSQLLVAWYGRNGSNDSSYNLATVPVSSNGTFSTPTQNELTGSGNYFNPGSRPTILKTNLSGKWHVAFIFAPNSSNKRYDLMTYTVGANTISRTGQNPVFNGTSATWVAAAIRPADNTILLVQSYGANEIKAKYYRTNSAGTGASSVGSEGNISPTYSTWGWLNNRLAYDELNDVFWHTAHGRGNYNANYANTCWVNCVPYNSSVTTPTKSTGIDAMAECGEHYEIHYWAAGGMLIVNGAFGAANENQLKLRWYPVTLNSSGNPVVGTAWRGINGTTDTAARQVDGWVYIPHQSQMLSLWTSLNNYSVRNVAWWNPSYTSTTLTSSNYLGIADSAASNNTEAKTIVFPGTAGNQSGLTTGTKYYVQTDGTLGTTADTISQVAGVAQSATTIKVQYS